jgi:hypothetical protein
VISRYDALVELHERLLREKLGPRR